MSDDKPNEKPDEKWDPSRYSPLVAVAEAFRVLTRDPAPLELHGGDLGDALPRTWLRLDEMQSLMLDPATGCPARDAAWRALAARARSEDPAWVVGAVGVALPRLRRITEHLTGGCAADRSDVEAVVLSAFVEALRTISIEHRHLEQRLLWAAHRAGAWRMYGQVGQGLAATPPGERRGVSFRAVLPDAASITHILT
jgi:hypothetical protein